MREYESKKSRLHLFAKLSAWTGIARLVDAFGVLNEYNTSSTEDAADYDAILSDWLAVGDEISIATDKQGKIVRVRIL